MGSWARGIMHLEGSWTLSRCKMRTKNEQVSGLIWQAEIRGFIMEIRKSPPD